MRALLLCGLVTGCASLPLEVVDDDQVDVPVEVTPPGPVQLALTPGRPRSLADDLVCTVVDPQADVTVTFTWTREGQPFDDVGTTWLAGDTVPAAALHPGETWTCEAVPQGPSGLRGPVAVAEATVRVPNVLLVIADDLGVGDVGAYGGHAIPTPALDGLAEQGVRFATAYVAGVTCSPSRAGILTGRRPTRFGFEFNIGEPARAEVEGRGLPPSELTLADGLGLQGLTMGYLGKWHLGVLLRFHPMARGFDGFLGFMSGQRYSQQPGLPGVVEPWPFDTPRPPWPADHWSDVLQVQGQPAFVDPEEHLTDRLAREAVAWVEDHQDTPWGLVLAFQAPHEPHQAPPDQIALLTSPPTEEGPLAYRAVVAGLDRGIGRVLDALDETGQADDTVVVVLSDHGCPNYIGWCSNAPYQGGKITMMEGGLRVPMIARWPDRLQAGAVFDDPVSSLDLLPTLIAATGGVLPGDAVLDGVDLLPWLFGERQGRPHERFVWHTGPARAIRQGDLKLVEVGTRRWLFDLAADPTEQEDLSEQLPDEVARLLGLLDAELAGDRPAMWPGRATQLPYYGELHDIVF